VDGITAGESVGVVRIAFESANVVPVFVDFSDEYPHAFSFLVPPIGIFGSETKEKFYISTHFEIAPEFFRWRVNIVSVLCHPNGVFKVIAILRMRGKRVVLLTFPRFRGRRAESPPTLGQIVQFVERRITRNHASERYEASNIWRGRIIGRTVELPSAIVVMVDALDRRSVEHECCRERRSIRWIIELPAFFHWCITIRITRPGVDVVERSEPAGLFRLAFIRLFVEISQRRKRFRYQTSLSSSQSDPGSCVLQHLNGVVRSCHDFMGQKPDGCEHPRAAMPICAMNQQSAVIRRRQFTSQINQFCSRASARIQYRMTAVAWFRTHANWINEFASKVTDTLDAGGEFTGEQSS
jgi:hypothetical protein